MTCELNTGDYERTSATDLSHISSRVVSLLPSLDARGTADSLATLFGMIALELLRLSGSSGKFLDVRDTLEPDWTRVTIEYDDEDTAKQALDDALDLLRAAAASDTFDVARIIAALRELRARRALGPGAERLVAEARRRGIPVRRFEDEDTIQLGLGPHLRRIEATLASDSGTTLDDLFPDGTSATIPVLAVTGTNGKTTTTRLIAHLFREAGRRVGFTTTDGTYIVDQLVDHGDNTGPYSANIVLSSPEIDVAVIEMARGGIVRAGVGVDALDVGVVLNVTSDHLGIDDIATVEQLAGVKGLVAAAVQPGGFAVLNADDPLVAQMRKRTRGQVAWFTKGRTDGSALLRDHLEEGGIVAGVDGEDFVIRRGASRMPIARAHDVPLTFDGAARFQYENILAALLAGFALGLDPEQLSRSLMTFLPSAHSTPGRLNIIRTPKGRIIVDYAHNAAAIGGLVDFVTNLGAGRRIAVIGAPGDRRDEDLREAGRLFSSFDYVFVKEVAKYRRGRKPGETAAVIAEGLKSGGIAPERIDVVDDEPTAVDRAVALMDGHAILVILADDHAKVLDQLGELGLAS